MKRMCFDRVLPQGLERTQRKPRMPNAYDENRREAIFVLRTLWTQKTKLRVRFVGGTQQQQKDVRGWASEWEKHINLSFEWNDAPDAEIRIAFNNDGAWSYVGTDCLGIPRDSPTMNFGWLDEAVVLHEFGHAIGLGHEHQNPDKGLEWNKQVVYDSLAGPPNFWTKDQVDHNVISKYSANQIRGSKFDKDSVMLYSFPPEWSKSGFSGGDNPKLSKMDTDFAALVYPKANPPGALELPVHEAKPTSASIGSSGEEDVFRFTAAKAGRYTIETSGPSDLVMTLFGPNSNTSLIAQDDDSGDGSNARIIADLAQGSYFVSVRHYNPTSGKGDYAIRVTR